MTPEEACPVRGLAKARSAVSARRSESRPMLRTRSDGLLNRRRRPSSFLALHVSRSLRSIIKKPGPRFASTLQVLSLAALTGLVIVIFSFPTPGEGEDDAGLAVQASLVRAKVEAIRQRRKDVSESLGKPKPSLKPKRRKKGSKIHPRKLGIIETVRKRFRFDHVKPLTRVERVQVGTFNETRRIGITNIAIYPEKANRFDVPWLLLRRVETRSFEETGYKILYSPMKGKASDGIGHGLTVLNAEVSTALNLGLSYTHRLGIYGSISREQRTAVEDIFGWGVGEVPRRFIQNEVCEVQFISNKRPPQQGTERCPVCRGIREDSALPIHDVVEIPSSLSYGCVSCHSRQQAVIDFMYSHAKNNTLFQMSPTKCDQSPKSPDFTMSYRYFYWKYWDMHGNKSFGSLPSGERKREGQQWAPPITKRGSVHLPENELVIAIHARRGDFLAEKTRRMVSSKVFAAVVRTAMDTVLEVGGVFSEMPVAVIVYSEGRRRKGAFGGLHDRALMDHDFVDTDGQVRDAMWFHRLLVPEGRSTNGNKTHSMREEGMHFPDGVRIEFRISTDLSEALHEMASADIFIGSPSDLSQYAVRVISRSGMQLLPKYMGAMDVCCMASFNERSGSVPRARRLIEFWRMYAMANEASAIRALRESLEK